MSRINYTRAELALKANLLKMGIQRVLFLADLASSFGKSNKSKAPLNAKQEENFQSLMAGIRVEVKKLAKQDASFYDQLELTKEEVKGILQATDPFTEETKKKLQLLAEKLKIYKKHIKTKQPTDHELVQSQRKKHQSKRFNVNEKWLPMK